MPCSRRAPTCDGSYVKADSRRLPHGQCFGILAAMTGHEPPDPRAKYRKLPPAVNAADAVESVDADVDRTDQADVNAGAGPYLRMMLGPWAR